MSEAQSHGLQKDVHGQQKEDAYPQGLDEIFGGELDLEAGLHDDGIWNVLSV